jgi:hypothetical protein
MPLLLEPRKICETARMGNWSQPKSIGSLSLWAVEDEVSFNHLDLFGAATFLYRGQADCSYVKTRRPLHAHPTPMPTSPSP